MSDDPIQRGQDEIDRITDELNLASDIGDVARAILVRAGEEGLFSGRAIEVTAGATVVIGCRQADLPYSARDIAAISTASGPDEGTDAPSLLTQIERTRRKLETTLDIETKVVKPAAYIDRFVSELELSSRTESVARDVLSRAVEADRASLSGKSPSGVAGAAIYLATLLCDERRTQSAIADVASSEMAIRSNYHALLTIFDQHDIRFKDAGLDTERFDHEVDKVTSGNGSNAVGEADSMNETGHDERIDSVV